MRRFRIAALAIAGLAVLAACNSAGEEVEDVITEQIDEDFGLEALISCPDDAEASEGEEFTCQATIDDQDFDIDVTFTSDDRFNYEPQQIVDTIDTFNEQSAISIEAEVGQAVESDCGDSEILVIEPGDTFECDITAADGTTGTATLELDEDGNIVVVSVE